MAKTYTISTLILDTILTPFLPYLSPARLQVLMNRVSTFLDTDAGDAAGDDLDAEGLLGFHLRANGVSVSR